MRQLQLLVGATGKYPGPVYRGDVVVMLVAEVVLKLYGRDPFLHASTCLFGFTVLVQVLMPRWVG